eukprot:3467704-Pyramimonas_sp.AAC.1
MSPPWRNRATDNAADATATPMSLEPECHEGIRRPRPETPSDDGYVPKKQRIWQLLVEATFLPSFQCPRRPYSAHACPQP